MAELQISTLQQPADMQTAEAQSEEREGAKFQLYKKKGIYEYRLVNGKPDKSRARITYNSGDVYDGGVKRSSSLRKLFKLEYEGEGSYLWQSGDRYDGVFRNGQIQGKGTFTAANGDVYEGAFAKGQFRGHGKYRWADGSNFEGEFKNGDIYRGIYTDKNGVKYACSAEYDRSGKRKKVTLSPLKGDSSEQQQNAQTDAAPAQNETLTVASETETPVATSSENEPTSEQAQNTARSAPRSGLQRRDAALLTSIRHSKKGKEFDDLYRGRVKNTVTARKRLLNILNFFTNSDAEQMERVFKSSRLFDRNAENGNEEASKLVCEVVQANRSSVDKLHAQARRAPESASEHVH